MIHVAQHPILRLLPCWPCSPEMLICRRGSSTQDSVHPTLETAVSRFNHPACDRHIILGAACSSPRGGLRKFEQITSQLFTRAGPILSHPVPSCPCAAEATHFAFETRLVLLHQSHYSQIVPPPKSRPLSFYSHPSKHSIILPNGACLGLETSEPHQPSNGPRDKPLAPTLALLTLDQTDRPQRPQSKTMDHSHMDHGNMGDMPGHGGHDMPSHGDMCSMSVSTGQDITDCRSNSTRY